MKKTDPTAYLDLHARCIAVLAEKPTTVEATNDKYARLDALNTQASALWFALLESGWTVPELDALCEQRTGRKVPR